MHKFSSWLRKNAESYLLLAAQRDVARTHDRPFLASTKGFKGVFFMKLFVPIYRVLPWKLRAFVLHAMPGSHRQTWTARERISKGPAI